MFEKLAIWYLCKLLKKCKSDNMEIVCRSNGWTYRKRNKEQEKSINETLKLIK